MGDVLRAEVEVELEGITVLSLGSTQTRARNEPERAPYLFSLSRQDAADKSVRKVAIPVTHAEAAMLEAALRAAIGRLLGW